MLAIIFLLGLLIGIAALLILILWLGKGVGGLSAIPESASADVIRQHLLWHSFYVNPEDPRGWMRKTSGFGWTVNFRTRQNVYIFVLLLLFCFTMAGGIVFSTVACGSSL